MAFDFKFASTPRAREIPVALPPERGSALGVLAPRARETRFLFDITSARQKLPDPDIFNYLAAKENLAFDLGNAKSKLLETGISSEDAEAKILDYMASKYEVPLQRIGQVEAKDIELASKIQADPSGQFRPTDIPPPIISKAPPLNKYQEMSDAIRNMLTSRPERTAGAQIALEARKAGLPKEEYTSIIYPEGSTLKRRIPRAAKQFAAGGVGALEGFAGFAEYLSDGEIGKNLADEARTWRQELSVESTDIFDELMSGAGSMAVFYLPGLGVFKGMKALGSILPKFASWAGPFVSASLESGTEAGNTYRNVKLREAAKTAGEVYRDTLRQEGKIKADKAAKWTFWMNLPLVFITNKLGIFGEKGGPVVRAVNTFLMEGVFQEGPQELIPLIAEGKGIDYEDWKRAGRAAFIGGTLGSGLSGVQSLIGRRGQQLGREAVDLAAAGSQGVEMGKPPLEEAAPEVTEHLEQMEAGAPTTEIPEAPPVGSVSPTVPEWVTKDIEEITPPTPPEKVEQKPTGVTQKSGFNTENHSLVDFIRLQGGLWPGETGEFKGEHRRYFSVKHSGYNLLNSKDGSSLDQARMAAEDAGFSVPETTSEFLDLLVKDIEAKKYDEYGWRVWHPSKEDFSEIWNQVPEEFQEEGGTVSGSTGKYKFTKKEYDVWKKYINRRRRAIELPELVQLAKGLMGGKYPKIRERLTKISYLGEFWSSTGDIRLKAGLFEDIDQAAGTLAHEIGHLVDWLPDKIPGIPRGNLWGRIASLNKYMKEYYFGKEIPRLPGYEDIFWRDPDTASTMKKELKLLTQIIKPFDETVNPKFTKYRYSGKELFADAFSTLMNDPELLREAAPKFYKNFFTFLGRKSEVKSLYEDIQNELTDWRKVFENRQQGFREMYGRGEEARRKALDKKKPSYWERFLSEFIDDKTGVISQRIAEAKKRGIEISPEENPVHFINEARHSADEVGSYIREIDEQVIGPVEAAGLQPEDVADIMLHERIVFERSKIANPHGMSPESSARQLLEIRNRIGPENAKLLQTAVNNYRKIRKTEIIPALEKSEMFSPEQMKYIKENDHYATFNVVKFMEERSGANTGAAQIFRQIGTLADIENPFTATVMKDIALIRAVNQNTAAKKTTDFLTRYFSGETKVTDKEWNGKIQRFVDTKTPNMGTIRWMENGEIKALDVNKYIADAFKYNPKESNILVEALGATGNFWREIFVGKRPGFWLFNLFRDYKRASKNLPGLTMSKFMPYYLKAIRPAFQSTFGVPPDVVREMEKGKMLGSIHSISRIDSESKQLERILATNKMPTKRGEGDIKKAFKAFWHGLGKITGMTERIPKIAGYEYLKAETDVHPREIGHLVRTQAGSPDFIATGKASKLIGSLLLFGNAAKEGTRSDIEAARENPSEYAFKTFKYNLLPKMLMYAGAAGFLGDWVKEVMKGASEYDKSNYFIIPLGITETGKSVYLRVPQDETGRMLGGIMWKSLNKNLSEDTGNLFDYMAGQAPNLNPTMTALNDIVNYFSNQNTWDSFRGKPTIPERVFEAGGNRRRKAFIRHLWNSLGGGIAYRFKYDTVEGIKSEIEKALSPIEHTPILNDVVMRFIKVSDYGKKESAKRITDRAKRIQINRSFDVTEYIIEAINIDKTSPADQVDLFTQLVKEGLAKPAQFRAFRKKFQQYETQRYGSVEKRSLIYGTNAEKLALLKEYKRTMEKSEYETMVQELVGSGHLSRKFLLENAPAVLK